MAITHERTELIVARGELYFEPYVSPGVPAGGELYFGNTPSFDLSRELTSVPVADSDNGIVFAKESPVISEKNKATFRTDHISAANLNFWFGQTEFDEQFSTQPATVVPISETILFKPARYYQLGVTPARPTGVRNISNLTVTDVHGNPIPIISDNLQIDTVNGRVTTTLAAPVITPTTVVFTYNCDQTFIRKSKSKPRTLYGRLRLIGRNIKGKSSNWFFPYVKLTPNDNFALKTGNDWQMLGFSVEIMKLNAFTEYLYVDTVDSEGATNAEQYQVDQAAVRDYYGGDTAWLEVMQAREDAINGPTGLGTET